MSDITPSGVVKVYRDLPLPIDGWQPYKLPELATNGFPFAPTFIVRKNAPELEMESVQTRTLLPFGFHFRRRPRVTDRPVIDLTKGYYDPQTQRYTIPLRAGGDTEGGTFETGSRNST
ncbi:MAG: hypothetical protein JO202_13245 [Ktedonobacteraceae bacterium]|nr:hypothetical protein [Ktedonobacteraceae bacterium]